MKPLTRKGAFHALKLRALALHNRQSENPRLVKEYHALLQALNAMQDISGAAAPEDQINDQQVQGWYAEAGLSPYPQ